jgi:predicted nucleic acid-binding protein
VNRFVVDASVAIKWWVPEIHSADALRYLDPDIGREAPDLLLAEVGNILWKKVNRFELTRAEAEVIAADLVQAEVVIHPGSPLLVASLRIALETGRSSYDCSYLALAQAIGAAVVTADRKLFNALQGGPYAGLIRWVEDPI